MSSFEELVAIMARLRAKDGCPWDQEQTHESLRPYLIEEAYEVLDAIDKGDDTEIKEELGDLLLQVVFHAQLASEDSRFTIEDVAQAINDKLIRRHPHVFGDVETKSAKEVLDNWEKIKQAEKGDSDTKHKSVLDGVPNHLPALLKAYRVQEKVARVKFDWDDIQGVVDKVHEEVEELQEAYNSKDQLKVEAEFGDLLFALVNLGRHMKITPEDALRGTIDRFIQRFTYVEKMMALNGESIEDASLERMDILWDKAKELERNEEKTI